MLKADQVSISNNNLILLCRSAKTIKEVRERLMKGKGRSGLDKVADIHVICSVLTGFLKSLGEPILTYKMHSVFVKAAG